MLRFDRPIAAVATGFLTFAAAPASAAILPASTVRALDVRVSATRESDVAFASFPDARCSLRGLGRSGELVAIADDTGLVRLHVRPDRSAVGAAVAADCRRGTREESLVVRMHPTAGAVETPAVRSIGTRGRLLPAGLDPATVTDAQLRQLALPPRPSLPGTADYAAWERALTTPVTRVAPTAVIRPDVVHRPAGHGIRHRNVTDSPTWSGIAATGAGGQYTNAQSFWGVPSVQMDNASIGSGYSAMWDGVDGYQSSDVIQNGTEQDAFYLPGIGSVGVYSAWYEFYPDGGATTLANIHVSPGDQIFSESWVCPAADGTLFGCYLFMDLTAREAALPQEQAQHPNLFSGDSAEWIIERPLINGTLHALPFYSTAAMTVASARDQLAGEWVYYSQEPYTVFRITNTAGSVLSDCWADPPGAAQFYSLGYQ